VKPALNNFPFQPAVRSGQFTTHGRDDLINLRFLIYDEFTGFSFTARISRLLRFAYRDTSFPKILVRVANPVESFGFMFIQDGLPPPLLDGMRDRLGKEPDLFNQLTKGQAKKFQGFHKQLTGSPNGFDSAHPARLGLTSSNTIPPTSANAPTTGGIK
jgi:hypothetical protein